MNYLTCSACKRSKPAAEFSDAAGTFGAILADRNASGQANQTGKFGGHAYSTYNHYHVFRQLYFSILKTSRAFFTSLSPSPFSFRLTFLPCQVLPFLEDLTDISDRFVHRRRPLSLLSVVLSALTFHASAFSASVFSASAFSASVFSASVFSASVFSASVFSASVFPASVFSASAFLTLAFLASASPSFPLALTPP